MVSLFSLCWAVVAYSRAHRRVRTDKKVVSWPGVVLQTIWRIGMISSRVVALVLFASAFKAYTFIVVGKLKVLKGTRCLGSVELVFEERLVRKMI